LQVERGVQVRTKGAKCNSQGQAKRSPWNGPQNMNQALKGRNDVVAPQFLFEVGRTVAMHFALSALQIRFVLYTQGFHPWLSHAAPLALYSLTR